MDIYYPPNFDFKSRIPVVVFVNGYKKTLPNWGAYITWGLLTAASGLIAINYQYDPDQGKLQDVLDYLQKNGRTLHVDTKQIGLFSVSSSCKTALEVALDKSPKYHKYLKCVIFYYPIKLPIDDENILDIPSLILRVDRSSYYGHRDCLECIDDFIAKAKSINTPITLLTYPEGCHAFDIIQDTPESKKLIKQTIDYMCKRLLGK